MNTNVKIRFRGIDNHAFRPYFVAKSYENGISQKRTPTDNHK